LDQDVMQTKVIECAYSIDGSGPPLFLIHGIGAARNSWAKLMPKLTSYFTVITYDLRGHGASPLPDAKFELADLVADLEHLRTRTGFEQAHFAGHSLGGMIGPAYARAFPDRVLSLGLLSTAAFRTEEDSNKVWAVVKAMEDRGIANVLETLTDRWFTDAFIAEHSDIVQKRLEQVIDTNPSVFLNVFRIYADTEMCEWLHEISAPSLVLTGEQDGGCNPRLNQQIADELSVSELVILPQYKHSLLLEAGEIVADNIIRFIRQSQSKI
jgi:pimeloyl-ACP methyl ester carboxylesterase